MPKKVILVTGANGQLGTEMRNVLDRNEEYEGLFTDINELDVTSENGVNKFFEENHFDYLVNCAAYTAVDKAEENREFAKRLNSDAVWYLAKACKRHDVKMIHISTDYVYNGCSYAPYNENNPEYPHSVYGLTKLDGEDWMKRAIDNGIIIRTSWLYSPYGNNFVKTMLRLFEEKDEISVVCDQIGTPTYALDLARAIMAIISSDEWKPGTYHYSNEGAISWYDFANAILRISGNTCRIKPCKTEDYPTLARRPNYSVLDKTKIKETFGIEIPYWEKSLEECLERYKIIHFFI